ncbi:MAG: NAD(P)/FAD-dependent oxidoreductase [Gammaproteobacteria bacterium]|nr:NAD(P)/FAD-dependent oxidoreductase [Gammaproteobacteria bacterium]
MTSPQKHAYGVIIIGAGPGGLCTAIKLREAGIEDFVILEKAEGVGGTWWHNRYPGAECDVKSHLYSFSFEIKTDWSRPFSGQAEILEYLQHVATKYGVLPFVRFKHTVRSARWQDGQARWEVETADGQIFRAPIVVSGMGMFNELVWPDIEGLDRFAGTSFHSARWDATHDLAGKHVAVIGSAASAVQFVPEIAAKTAKLHLFQRTANWVAPKEDTPYTPEQLEVFRDDPNAIHASRAQIYKELNEFILFSDPVKQAEYTQAALNNIAVVKDPVLRAKLTPTHPFGCKRPLFSNLYYPVFNLPQVELVTARVTALSRDSVVTADGVERKVDTVIFATGFEVTRYLSAIEVTGRNDRRLEEAWSDGAQAYLGIVTSGFPNLFMLYGPNTNNGSIISMLEIQVDYIVRQIKRIARERLAFIDLRAEVETGYNDAMQSEIRAVEVWQANCGNYYSVASGRMVTQWPHTIDEFCARTLRPDAEVFEAQRAVA